MKGAPNKTRTHSCRFAKLYIYYDYTTNVSESHLLYEHINMYVWSFTFFFSGSPIEYQYSLNRLVYSIHNI